MAAKFRQKEAKIALISVLCKKSRNFSLNSQVVGAQQLQICYLEFQESQGSCHGNQIQTKKQPKWYKFQFRAKNRGIFRMHSRVYRVMVNSNMLPKFSREQRELLRQSNSRKENKITLTSVVCKKSRNLCAFVAQAFMALQKSVYYYYYYRINSQVLGPANSNMLYKISRESGELPWQPNLSKNKQTLH